MNYAIKEMFYSLQGEGAHAGRPAVFIRFAGCNLWSGREADRATAVCKFCDTDFVGTDGAGGGKYTATGLAAAAADLWPRGGGVRPYCVLTGGEPMLQVDEAAVTALHDLSFEIAVETNGTRPVLTSIDWITVSPKRPREFLTQTSGDELKLVFPQDGIDPADFLGLAFGRYYLQPKDGPQIAEHTASTLDYCLRHPEWRLSTQLHKFWDVR